MRDGERRRRRGDEEKVEMKEKCGKECKPEGGRRKGGGEKKEGKGVRMG